MSWFNKHSVQAFFYNKIWVIRRAGEARRSLCVLLLCTMSSFWLWFVMICHHLRDCATCDSNRDNMTAGCWPLWCACFSSKFTDPYKEKPGLHPDSTTGWKSSNCSFGYCEWKRDASFIVSRLHLVRTWNFHGMCVSLDGAGCMSMLFHCRTGFLRCKNMKKKSTSALCSVFVLLKVLQKHCIVTLHVWTKVKATYMFTLTRAAQPWISMHEDPDAQFLCRC